MKNKTSNGSLELARRIRAAGIRIHIDQEDREAMHAPSDGLLIYLVGGVIESTAFDLEGGGTGFIIHAAITINLPTFAISAFGLELPWKDAVRWFEDPVEIDGSSKVYRFGGRNLPEFERSEVLNLFADVRRNLPRGSSLKGYLLGVGDESIPDHFRHGMMIPGFLTISDQYWREYRSSVSLWADRSQKLLRRTRSKVTRKRLFDCPDPGFDHTRLQEDDSEANRSALNKVT